MRISSASIVKHSIDTTNQSYMDNLLAELSKLNGKETSWVARFLFLFHCAETSTQFFPPKGPARALTQSVWKKMVDVPVASSKIILVEFVCEVHEETIFFSL